MRAGHALILTALGLLVIGVVMVSSAGLRATAGPPLDLPDVLLGRTALFALLAVTLMAVAWQLPVGLVFRLRGFASPVPWLLGASLILLIAVHMPGIGREVNGARRWIDLGPIGFQPSEVVKWSLPLVIAWHAARRAGAMGRLGTGFVAPMTAVAVLCALIASEDLGTAVLIAVVATLMLVAAGTRLGYVAALVPIGLVGFVAAVIASPYRIARLRGFLDPYEDPQGIGYHVLQSMAAVSGGGLAGHGLGAGARKFGYLPEDTTDFIFSVICEELGLAGATLVVCLYVGLLFAGLRIVTRAQHPFQRLLALGILLTIGLQALLNLLVVTGMAPTKGIALPLISSGGTGWCLTAFAIGLLASIDRESDILEGGCACAPSSSPAAAPAVT